MRPSARLFSLEWLRAGVGLMLVCACLLCVAAPVPRWWPLADTPFQNYATEQGLPHAVAMAVAEDHHGFIWVGTQGGLARWDGYRFHNYQTDPKQTGSLPSSFIQSLHRDRQGRLWVGTSNGLARYDSRTDQFVRITGLSDPSITAIADDGKNDLWVATPKGLHHIATASNSASQMAHDPGQIGNAASNPIQTLLMDKTGKLWLGTQNGLMQYTRDGFELLPLPLPAGILPRISTLNQSGDGSIWIGTFGHGVYVLPPGSTQVQALDPAVQAALSTDTIISIREALPGQMWLATETNGIVVLDLASLQTRRLNHMPGLASSLPSNAISHVFRDRAGLIWVASTRGVSLHDPSQNAVLTLHSNTPRHSSIADTDVRAVQAMPDGRIWLGLVKQGIDLISSDATQLNLVQPQGKLADPSWPPPVIRKVSTPINNRVYVATNRGLFRTDSEGRQVQRLGVANLDPEERISALAQIGNTLWLGTRHGLWQLEPGTALVAKRVPGTQALDQENIIVLEPGPGQTLWIGTNNVGVYRYHRDSTRLQTFLHRAEDSASISSNAITTMLLDSRGGLWVGTFGAGINYCPTPLAEALAFRRIGMPEGLPNPIVDKLLEDGKGHIWASTDDGLARIERNTLAVRRLQRAEGVVLSSYWPDSGAMTRDGELVFGASGGLTVVQPDKLLDAHPQAPVVVTSAQVGGHAIAANPFNHEGTNHLPDALPIPPDNNSLAIEFSALDYSAPERNRYAYRLDGYDKNWIQTDPTRRVASYTNLPPGEYRLHLRGANRNAEWHEQEKIVPIQVLPSWYQTWWFHIVQGVLALAGIYAVVQVRTYYLRKRQLALESQVKRALELRHNQEELLKAHHELASAHRHLQETQQQMLLNEKMAGLGTLTAGVAHEINNPTNFTQLAAQMLHTDLHAFESLIKDMLQADDAPEVVDLFNQHFAKLNRHADTILEGTNRIKGIVQDLRTFTRLNESDTKSVRLSECILSTLNLVRTSWLEKVEFETHFVDDPEIECWPALLNQVFMNLLINGCQAIAEKHAGSQRTGHLRLSLHKEGDYLVFRCEDDGIGMTEATKAHMLEPFYTTKPVGTGTGLGLSIAYGIIQKHGGTLTVHSQIGVGSCFAVALPFRPARPSPALALS